MGSAPSWRNMILTGPAMLGAERSGAYC